MDHDQELPIFIAETPQGQLVAETPETSAPGVNRTLLGVYGEWLGDPHRRYGHLTSARHVPIHTRLEMLTDPVIALCQGYVSAMLVRATRVVECADERKRLFFEAMFRAWESEFIRQAALSVALGSVGLVKKFRFTRPKPMGVGDPPVWTAAADPLIVRGFDSVYPVGASPKFKDRGRHFCGIETADGPIDTFYALWLTAGRPRAFGSYLGYGRLQSVYNDWWMKYFGRDLYLVHLQKFIDRITVVRHPEGKTRDGRRYSDIARATGDAARAGATVAMPSAVYEVTDAVTSEQKLSAVRKWEMDFLEGTGAVVQFHQIDDHHDAKMALGYLVPPQMFMYVRQSSLGGPTTADVLGRLAEQLLMIDAEDIDQHVNAYVFPAVDRANFPPGSPPVKVRTVGLEPDARGELAELIRVLFSRADADVAYFDTLEAMQRLGLPVRASLPERDEGEEPGTEKDKDQNEEQEGETEMDEEKTETEAQAGGIGARSGNDQPPMEVLERIANTPLPPLPGRPDGEDLITERDVDRVLRRLKREIPELFE